MPSSEKNASFYVVFLSCTEPFSSFLLFTISMVLLMDIFYKMFVDIISIIYVLRKSVTNEHFCSAEDFCHMHW